MALSEDEKKEMEDMMIRICREILIPEVVQKNDKNTTETIGNEDAHEESEKENTPNEQIKEEEVVETTSKSKEALLIAIAGTKPGVGVTHHAIVIAKTLQNAGRKIALMDMSSTKDLSDMNHEYLEGISFYAKADVMQLDKIAYEYDIIVIDMGCYSPEVRSIFNRCDKKIIIAGGALWESKHLEPIYLDKAENYCFLFNHVPEDEERKKSIEQGMSPLTVIFSRYLPEPFFNNYDMVELFDLLELDV